MPDPFRVRCPHCRRLYHLRLDAEKLGRLRQKAFCGRCKRRFSLSPRVIERRTEPPPSVPPGPDSQPPGSADGERVSTVGMETWATLVAGVAPVSVDPSRPQTPAPVGGDDEPPREAAIDEDEEPSPEVAAVMVHVASEPPRQEEIVDESEVESADDQDELVTVAPPAPPPEEEHHDEASRVTLVHGDIDVGGLLADAVAEATGDPMERSGEIGSGDRPSRTRGRSNVVMSRDDWIDFADPGLAGIVPKGVPGAEALARLLGD
jgi:hypothetical protein